MYQYYIQIGNYPNVSFFRISEAIFKTRESAEIAAVNYLVKKRGFNQHKVSKKWIHTRFVHTNTQVKTPRVRPALGAPQCPRNGTFGMFDWNDREGKRVWIN